MKRFTETNKWRDPWFRCLSPVSKLLWLYLCDNCDNAGVIEIDLGSASFHIGKPVNKDHIRELGDRVKPLSDSKSLLPKFVVFQFGELKPTSIIHRSVIDLLKRHGLESYPTLPSHVNGMDRGCQSPMDKEKEKEKERGGVGGKWKKPSIEELKLQGAKIGLPESEVLKFNDYYESNGWRVGKNPMKSWVGSISNWKRNYDERRYENRGKTSQSNPRNSGVIVGPTNYATAKPRLQRELEAKRAASSPVAGQVAPVENNPPGA